MKITRRRILKSLLFSPLAAAIGKQAEAAKPQPNHCAARPLLLNRFAIAGFRFYDGPALVHRLRSGIASIHITAPGTGRVEQHGVTNVKESGRRQLKPGARLRLVREPDNRHDRFAVAIHLGKAKLGYVPRSDNKHISRLLRQGATLDCRVVEVDPGAVVYQMVKVEVVLTGRLNNPTSSCRS
ncbi:MAG: HIRAN domain-containing protein [Deltaproteobacteria bacterium]|nr:HIRAN domain-containing protein [Deltaproteobacteria bacterium]